MADEFFEKYFIDDKNFYLSISSQKMFANLFLQGGSTALDLGFKDLIIDSKK